MTKSTNVEPVERATNRSWTEWMKFMDGIGAKDLDHKSIATEVYKQLEGTIDKPGWWAQAVTVAYEQYIGRRIPGQMTDGKFQTSASKSTQLGMQELMDVWTVFAAKDKEVLSMISGEVRVSGTANRINWRVKGLNGSSIIITSEPKANGTATIIATHMGLESAEENQTAKETWQALLARFLDI